MSRVPRTAASRTSRVPSAPSSSPASPAPALRLPQPDLRAAPSPHPRFDAGRCFRELVADLAGGRFAGAANVFDRFAMTFACRAAVKAGDRLSEPEMRELLLRLFATDLPPHDVHGRATIVQLPREELERRFGRR